jgi:hypothetical protein
MVAHQATARAQPELSVNEVIYLPLAVMNTNIITHIHEKPLIIIPFFPYQYSSTNTSIVELQSYQRIY